MNKAKPTLNEEKRLEINGGQSYLMSVLEFIALSLRGFIRPSKETPGLYWLRKQFTGEFDKETGALVIRRKTLKLTPERANRKIEGLRKPKLNCEIVWDGRFRNETFIKANAKRPVDHCEDWQEGLYGVDPALL